MIHDLKPYPILKESGVAWTSRLPTHWRVLRGKFLFRCVDVRSEKGEEELLTVSSDRGIVRRSSVAVTMFKAESYVGHKLCWPGDLVINSLWAWAGGLGVSQYHGIVSSAYGVYRLRDSFYSYSSYMDRLVRSRPYNLELRVRSKGIWISRLLLTDEAFLNASFPIPPQEERSAIIRFLDHADRRLQRYIRAKQKLIALLEEQRQAVIHEAVTGQIDVRTGEPYSAYKSSGVDWLGSVPVRWEVAPLRRVTLDRCDGPFGSGLKSSHYTDQGIRVVRLQNIGHGEFRDSDATFISPEHYSSLGDHSVLSGDVLIAGLGDNNHPAGRACVAPEGIIPAMVKADCFRFRLNMEHIRPRFAALQLTATATLASAALSTGATRQRTNLKATAGRAISIPSVSEQNSIVQYITTEVSTITRVQAAVQEKIRLLNEYRARLIADVVTGKIDVREAAAELPEDNGLGVSEELADEHAVDQEVIV